MTSGAFDPLMFALFLGALSLIPLMMIVCTCFLKIAIVLLITRNAIGVQQVPPNMALYGIALAATLFVMAPVFQDITTRVQEKPLDMTDITSLQASVTYGLEPLQTFMSRNVDPDILTHLHENSLQMWPASLSEKVNTQNLLLVIPAFVLSELQAGFKIGFLIYIPFIVIDLIVSNVLLALGMQMVAPMTLSLPLKLLLFVLVNGWTRLLDGLFYSYL
ncbi:EscR/YscR/HrcR family type III secretion system export apparatus protein [Pectobacterium actinidiae]|uniref:EscR/YscR/HrcR family type III secretion system export apparatus protein n=1 Tax=Pectobacterium actinidiae TaxID=1507808 RepID=A0A1V2R310_9GAMM|nr:type III secretion system export apparatus subunit SctR [Pectobacterium actinidiae]GKW14939.1 EscR/YscR/HrcR family type III secretion system export apparatus protein [Pectobacterium carotovorum subsp. carotovorum]KHN92157.1 type III secretion system protein [Pectobacterium actinidiae]MDY4313611.1 type III secretion system export apparatus subunit SctR [Pectobacterium actinidiae]ONK03894.1 EscR/YscR/HrcR family type III secretion system export apparatus protein [Pectobacterium actinidiae]ON